MHFLLITTGIYPLISIFIYSFVLVYSFVFLLFFQNLIYPSICAYPSDHNWHLSSDINTIDNIQLIHLSTCLSIGLFVLFVYSFLVHILLITISIYLINHSINIGINCKLCYQPFNQYIDLFIDLLLSIYKYI